MAALALVGTSCQKAEEGIYFMEKLKYLRRFDLNYYLCQGHTLHFLYVITDILLGTYLW